MIHVNAVNEQVRECYFASCHVGVSQARHPEFFVYRSNEACFLLSLRESIRYRVRFVKRKWISHLHTDTDNPRSISLSWLNQSRSVESNFAPVTNPMRVLDASVNIERMIKVLPTLN